jgi:iron complex outermembrane recepter protein
MITLKKLTAVSAVIALCDGSFVWAAVADVPPQPPTSVDAETPAKGLQEVVVTAQKRSERLQDVPIAVSAVSGDQLESAGITNTMQLAEVVPGLQISSNGGNFEPRLRGIGSTATGPGVEESVALVVDGVYYANPLFGPAQLFGVDQVAVLKGPQGTLFGRNATAGVIQITTKDPTQDFEGEARTSLDNFLTTRSDIYLSGGVTDTLTTSFSGEYAHQGRGWGTTSKRVRIFTRS